MHSLGNHHKTWNNRTVTKECYIDVLNKFWSVLRTHHGVNWEIQCFQRDVATLHTANIIMEWLNHRFPNRLISRHHELEWCLHLKPPEKKSGGSWWNNPQSIAELKVAINQKIHAILKKEYVKVVDSFAWQIQVCHQHNGGHLKYIQ